LRVFLYVQMLINPEQAKGTKRKKEGAKAPKKKSKPKPKPTAEKITHTVEFENRDVKIREKTFVVGFPQLTQKSDIRLEKDINDENIPLPLKRGRIAFDDEKEDFGGFDIFFIVLCLGAVT
jgi:hypothetical protein